MRRFGAGSRCIPGLVLALSLVLPARASAQSWALVDGLGYGGVGALAGVALAWDQDYGSGFSTILVGTGAGVLVGGLVGHAADRTLARGEALGGAHKAAVVTGSVLAGTVVGALASAALINGEGSGTPLGSDESTFTVLTLGGAGLGVAYAWWRRDALNPRGVTATPRVSADGEVGLHFQVRF